LLVTSLRVVLSGSDAADKFNVAGGERSKPIGQGLVVGASAASFT
jgi:hypothetical protein